MILLKEVAKCIFIFNNRCYEHLIGALKINNKKLKIVNYAKEVIPIFS